MEASLLPQTAPAPFPMEHGGSQALTSAETASTAVAALAQAQVQARYIMALRRPRDWVQVRTSILRECQRPGFANAALYSKPVGGGTVEGFSIRFAEAAVRYMTNIMPETVTLFDDNRKRVVRVSLTDLEYNVTYSADLTLEKTVERKKLRANQRPLGVRTNSYGDTVYLVEATEGDLLNKEGAAVSKAIRNLALRLLPGDIQDDARAAINATLQNAAARDPDAERKVLADSFSAIGIQPKDLTKYLGHDLAQLVPAEMVELRRVYRALRDGESTWKEVLEAKVGTEDSTKPAAADASDPKPRAAKGTQRVLEKLKSKSAPKETPPPAQEEREGKDDEEPPPWKKHLDEEESDGTAP
jgi:hypothetical protein